MSNFVAAIRHPPFHLVLICLPPYTRRQHPTAVDFNCPQPVHPKVRILADNFKSKKRSYLVHSSLHHHACRFHCTLQRTTHTHERHSLDL
jgi:hypothetical protein